ncbi:hypothetical protein CF70_017830 [Cupriavidus sp. SK-3]|uniref:hypothetical protein n=1 Tax=Cupriavidus sp. SK-3 TaxID=1470558 RepID=UPI00044F4E70|nr:hypothetical protein [Cupriavidus sp. SK-3]KDP84679.1 hypothetical protein CF70_017830 [Cupriavidus sp. SK-3]
MKKIQKTKHAEPGLSMNSLAVQLKDKGLRLAATSRARITAPPKPHIDDIAVDQLAIAQKAKLTKCRDKGRGGWDNPLECSVEKLAQMMAEAVCKGDPVDVANFAAMLQARGASHQAIAEHATRALLRGSREQNESDLRNAARYLKLRDVPDRKLGVPGIPCISIPTSASSGNHINGGEADHAIDSISDWTK